MPDITALHIGIGTVAVIAGVLLGWIGRGRRSSREKSAINFGWQEQIEAQRIEHNRLAAQNRSLMEQVAQYQASSKDARNRSQQLSAALKEALERRDELQREVKEVRGNLESLHAIRKKLESDVLDLSANDSSMTLALRDKDEKIFKLSRELDSWANRLPPLIERFRERNDDATRLECELAEARELINALETEADSDPPQSGNGYDATVIGESDTRDDLKQIKGVGPAIEKTLNELGIFRFSQIAEMSEYDIDRVARNLKGFRSRIYREDWIGQARELQAGPSVTADYQ